MNAWIVGTVRRLDGYPIPVTVLIFPQPEADGLCSVFIDVATALHVRRTEVASRHVSFAEWYRANGYSDLGRMVERVLPSEQPVDMHVFLAAVEYCRQARASCAGEVRSAMRIVAEAHGDLVQQIAGQNARVAY